MLIASNFFESSSSGMCKYACLLSSFVNFRPPPSVAKMSSMRGSVYWSTCSTWFTVTIKSQILTESSFLSTGTIGEAQSLISILKWYHLLPVSQFPFLPSNALQTKSVSLWWMLVLIVALKIMSLSFVLNIQCHFETDLCI